MCVRGACNQLSESLTGSFGYSVSPNYSTRWVKNCNTPNLFYSMKLFANQYYCLILRYFNLKISLCVRIFSVECAPNNFSRSRCIWYNEKFCCKWWQHTINCDIGKFHFFESNDSGFEHPMQRHLVNGNEMTRIWISISMTIRFELFMCFILLCCWVLLQSHSQRWQITNNSIRFISFSTSIWINWLHKF